MQNPVTSVDPLDSGTERSPPVHPLLWLQFDLQSVVFNRSALYLVLCFLSETHNTLEAFLGPDSSSPVPNVLTALHLHLVHLGDYVREARVLYDNSINQHTPTLTLLSDFIRLLWDVSAPSQAVVGELAETNLAPIRYEIHSYAVTVNSFRTILHLALTLIEAEFVGPDVNIPLSATNFIKSQLAHCHDLFLHQDWVILTKLLRPPVTIASPVITTPLPDHGDLGVTVTQFSVSTYPRPHTPPSLPVRTAPVILEESVVGSPPIRYGDHLDRIEFLEREQRLTLGQDNNPLAALSFATLQDSAALQEPVYLSSGRTLTNVPVPRRPTTSSDQPSIRNTVRPAVNHINRPAAPVAIRSRLARLEARLEDLQTEVDHLNNPPPPPLQPPPVLVALDQRLLQVESTLANLRNVFTVRTPPPTPITRQVHSVATPSPYTRTSTTRGW
jgi:hypothetical protein